MLKIEGETDQDLLDITLIMTALHYLDLQALALVLRAKMDDDVAAYFITHGEKDAIRLFLQLKADHQRLGDKMASTPPIPEPDFLQREPSEVLDVPKSRRRRGGR